MEQLTGTGWWADFYAAELLVLSDAAAASPTVPFYICAVAQGSQWVVRRYALHVWVRAGKCG